MIRAVLAAVLALCATLPAAAQEWPAKPVRIVVPYAVGGIADTFSRLLAVALAESTGQTVVTDNRPGGNGLVGSDIVVVHRLLKNRVSEALGMTAYAHYADALARAMGPSVLAIAGFIIVMFTYLGVSLFMKSSHSF